MFLTSVLRVAVGRISVIADAVKDMVATKGEGWEGGNGVGERTRETSEVCGGAATGLGNAVWRWRRLQIEKQPCKNDGKYR